MAKPTASAIIFTINAAIRLGRNMQQAFAQSIRARAITLPIPDVRLEADIDLAHQYFKSDDPARGGHQFLDTIEDLADLHSRAFFNPDRPDLRPLNGPEERRYIDYYLQLRKTQEAAQIGLLRPDQVNAAELAALFSIRQWNTGKDPDFSPVRKIAGTLVEIGIDYFNQVPGALNRQSSLGQALEHFLDAFDRIPLSDKKRLRKHAELIVPELFVAAAESLTSLSDELTSDPKIQQFVQAAGQGIARDLARRIERMPVGDMQARRDAVDWGRILLRSAISNSAYYVVDGPERLFDLNDGGRALIQQTGGVLLEAILEQPDGIDLGAGLSRPVLDRLLQTTFGVFAQHPDLINSQVGFKEVVRGVSGALAITSFQNRPDYLPEIARLILEESGRHIELILNPRGSSSQHVLVEAARQTLFALSDAQGGRWKPRLGKDQLLRILNQTVSLTTDNPNWILAEIDHSSLLREAVSITLEVLGDMPDDRRFSTETILAILEAVLDGLVGHEAVLGLIKWGDGATEEAILRRALKLIIEPITEPRRGLPHHQLSDRRLHRRQMVLDLVEFAFERILNRHPDKRGLQLLALLSQQYISWNREHALHQAVAEDMLDLGLQVLAANPEKLLGEGDLAALGAQLFTAVEALEMRQIRGYEILPELFRLCLRTTAANAELVVGTDDQSEPRYLAVILVWHSLEALAGHDEAGAWCPDLSIEALLSLLENLLDAAVAQPEWLTELAESDPIHRQVLQAVMDSLAKMPDSARIRPETLELVLWSATRAALTSPLLVRPDDTTGRTLVGHMLDIIISFVYDPAAGSERTAILDHMLRLVAEDFFAQHPNRRGVALLQLILASYDYQHDQPFDLEQGRRLAQVGLELLSRYPQLLSDEEKWQRFLADLSGSLAAATTDIDHLLPEIMRLALRAVGMHAEALLEVSPGSPRILIAQAIEQTLVVATRPPESGAWRPQFSGVDLLDLLDITLAQVAANPQWVKNDLLRRVLEALWSLIARRVPKGEFSRSLLLQLVQAVLASVSARRTLALPIVDHEGHTHDMVLEFALDQLLLTIYDPSGNDIAQWTLHQDEVILAIVEAYLYRLERGPVDPALVEAMNRRIQRAVQQLIDDGSWVLDELLQELQSMTLA